MATQEIRYASMAQVVDPSLQASSVTRDSKKPWHMVPSQAPTTVSAWMTNFHNQQQGGARMWLNLIKVSVPAVTSSGPPVFTNHFMTLHNFHRDAVSVITLDTRAVVSDFDLKTLGFLMYPDCSDDHSPDFDILVRQILMDGVPPLAQHYFQGYFLPRGPPWPHKKFIMRAWPR